MITHAKRLSGSNFVRNVAIVATGTAGAQAITMAFSPIITRLYGPEAFGVLGTFTSILAVLAPLAALSYPIAIVLPKRDEDAVALARLSIGIAFRMSLLTALVLLLFKTSIIEAFNLQAVESFILLLPLAMLFSAFMAVVGQLAIRERLYKVRAKAAVIQSIWLNFTKSFLGLWMPTAIVLVLVSAVSSAVQASLIITMMDKGRIQKFKKIMRSEEKAFRRKRLALLHKDFALYRTPQEIVKSASQSIPVILLAIFLGPAAAGFYTLANTVIYLPTALIGQSLSTVFYPRFNESVINKEFPCELLVKSTCALAAIGLLPYIFVAIFGPLLFKIVFGEGWQMAGMYAQWLAILGYSVLVSQPSFAAIPVLKLQGINLMYEVLRTASVALSMLAGLVFLEDGLMAIILFSITGALFNFAIIFICYIKAGKMTRRFAK